MSPASSSIKNDCILNALLTISATVTGETQPLLPLSSRADLNRQSSLLLQCPGISLLRQHFASPSPGLGFYWVFLPPVFPRQICGTLPCEKRLSRVTAEWANKSRSVQLDQSTPVDSTKIRAVPCRSNMNDSPASIVVPLSILSTFVVVSNVLVCVLVLSQRRMRTYTNGFVVSLAFSDITIGITMFIQYNAELHKLNRDLVNIIYSFVFICGVANLCAVTFDRHLAVTRPFQYQATIAKVFKICVPLIWILSMFIGAAPLLWGGGTRPDIHQVYQMIYILGFFLLPYLFILVANMRIFRLVRKCVQRERQLSISSPLQNGTTNNNNRANSKRNARKMSSEAKVARVFALAALMFVLSWFPTIYHTFATAFTAADTPAVIQEMSPFTVVLGSGINPVLYSFMKPDFRQTIRKIFKQLQGSRDFTAFSLGGRSSLGENSSAGQRELLTTPTAIPASTPPATQPDTPVDDIDLAHPLIETVV